MSTEHGVAGQPQLMLSASEERNAEGRAKESPCAARGRQETTELGRKVGVAGGVGLASGA